MLHRGLTLIAFACCGLVVASFVMFARDQLAGASIHQQTELATGRNTAAAPITAHHEQQPRRFIDDATRTITSPFSSIVQTDSQWVLHGFSTIIALLIYGVGLGYLARFSRGLT